MLTIILPIEACVTFKNVKEVPMTEMIPVPYMYLPLVPGILHPNTCSDISTAVLVAFILVLKMHMAGVLQLGEVFAAAGHAEVQNLKTQCSAVRQRASHISGRKAEMMTVEQHCRGMCLR